MSDKYCVGCKHYQAAWTADQIYYAGMANANAVDPETGQKVIHPDPIREPRCLHPKNRKVTDRLPRFTPDKLRAELLNSRQIEAHDQNYEIDKVCGYDARWFEQREDKHD